MLNHITLISNDVFHFGNRNLVSRHKCDLVQLASLKFFYIDVIMHLFSWIPSTQSFRMYVNFLPSFLPSRFKAQFTFVFQGTSITILSLR